MRFCVVNKVFLEEFEEQSKAALFALKNKYNELAFLPEQLTACAGITYIKASQPFYQGYALAESLCKQAKIFSKNHRDQNQLKPSSVVFHWITTSIIDDYDVILKQELRTNNGIQFTMQAYLVGKIKPKISKYVHLDNLIALRQFLTKPQISQGTFHEYLSLLEISQEQAESIMQRWYDNTKNSGQDNLLNELKNILEELKQKV